MPLHHSRKSLSLQAGPFLASKLSHGASDVLSEDMNALYANFINDKSAMNMITGQPID